MHDPGTEQWLAAVWDGILSREPEQIRQTYAALDLANKAEVMAHLKRMTTEDGWHPGQVESARAALGVLENDTP
jgi:hypothetical protein